MVDRKDVGSWIEGPRAARAGEGTYPGQRLGLPEHGPGSVARFGRRLVAIFIDWTLCQLVAVAFLGGEFGRGGAGGLLPLAVFFAENVTLVGTVGFTVGHRIMGLRVVRLGGAPAGPVPGLVRSLLLAIAVPALIWDKDERGLHDKAAGTVIIRTR
ncbi:MAG TPA: RDD family protein [Oryzihumus sp.]|nr:RDD family protein [Oryzihumus sp.]